MDSSHFVDKGESMREFIFFEQHSADSTDGNLQNKMKDGGE